MSHGLDPVPANAPGGVEATLREVLEHAQGASYKRNLKSNTYEYLSPIFTGITGRTVESVKTMHLDEMMQLFHPDDIPGIQAAVTAALQDPQPAHHRVDYRFRHLEGHYVWFRDEFKLLRGDAGDPLALVGCVSDVTASKALEEELQQSQANLEALVESTPDLIWSVDRNHVLISFNSALANHFLSTYGVRVRKGVTAEDLLPEDRAGLWPTLYERAFKDGPFHHELNLQDGRCLDFTLHPIRRGEAVVGTSVFGKDVTERIRAEQALQASVAQVQGLLRAIPDLIFRNSREGEYLDFRAFDASLLLVPPEAFLHRTMAEVLPGPLADQFMANLVRALDLNEIQVLQYDLVIGGATHWFEARMVPCGEDQVVTISRDITEQIHAEWALKEEKDKYVGLFEHMHSGFILLEVLLDPAGNPVDHRLLEANAEFEAQTGLKRELEIGRTSAGLSFQWPPEVVQALYKVALGGAPTTYERFNESLQKYYDVRVFSPRPCQWGMLFNDITERKQAERDQARLKAEVEQMQKMESLGRLAGGVAHDMNNVLGAILGLASAHLAIQSEEHATYPAFETIRDAATRGGEMVKRLLSFARQNPVERRELDLNALLLEEVRLLERTTLARVHLELDLAPDLDRIQGDGSALAHLFMNLCVNAVDAMGGGGTLTFRTRNLGGRQVEVVVADTGCGMSPEVMARAMDPYFTTKEIGKGTGLGLSLVHSTVKAHHGHIRLESEPGRGTQVRITFPATAAQEAVREPLPEVRPAPAAAVLRVLLVDDDELIQKATRMLLTVLGHAVTVASGGEAALALVQQGLGPDVVILDMNMPGLGGKGTLPRLRDLLPDVPILLATGRADQEALDLVAAHPGVTLMTKPFSFDELLDQLHQVQPARP